MRWVLRKEATRSWLHRSRVIPRSSEVTSELFEDLALLVGHWPLDGLHLRQAVLRLLQLGQLLIEPLLQRVGHQPVLRIDEIELLEGSVSRALCGLEAEARLLHCLATSLRSPLLGHSSSLDGLGCQRLAELLSDGPVDELRAEGETPLASFLGDLSVAVVHPRRGARVSACVHAAGSAGRSRPSTCCCAPSAPGR